MRFYLQDLSKYVVGILGGGQLGWMMILEGRRYPVKFYVLANPDDPACRIADRCYSPGEFKDMVDSADVVTFEFEHVYEEALRYAHDKGKLLPRIDAVDLKRERWKEREFYRRHGIPTPRFFVVEGVDEVLRTAKNEFNYLCVIKQSRGGYDGKGQYFIKRKEDLEAHAESLARVRDEVFVVEEYVDFDYEASIIAVRGLNGETRFYPPTYNYNLKGILVYNYGPMPGDKIRDRMVEIAKKILDALSYVGTMGIEFFIKDGEVLVNELAPRVHNTGHYTLDAAFVSQFEQHLRAILGLELGETSLLAPGGMVNILGLDNVSMDVCRYGKLYWYGKKEARRRRKTGHINVVGIDLDDVKKKIDVLMSILYPDGVSNYI